MLALHIDLVLIDCSILSSDQFNLLFCIALRIMNRYQLRASCWELGRAQALLMQESLLAGIQYSFFVALGINIVGLILVFFVKRVDTSIEPDGQFNQPADVKK